MATNNNDKGKTRKKKLPTTRMEALDPEKNPLLNDLFALSGNNTSDIRIRENRDRYMAANYYGGLPNQKLEELKKDPELFKRFDDFSRRRSSRLREGMPDYMNRYHEETDVPFRVPLTFTVSDALSRKSIGAPQPQMPTLADGGLLPMPEYGFGSWLKENGAGLLKGAGSLVSMIPGIGQIAGPVLSTAGSVISGVQQKNAQQDAAQAQVDQAEAAAAEEQRLIDRNTRTGNIVNKNQMAYAPTFANGGNLMINDYTNGNTHQEGVGGIPVDARGNPATTSKSSMVGLTEKGEVTWNGYVFSDKIKIT